MFKKFIILFVTITCLVASGTDNSINTGNPVGGSNQTAFKSIKESHNSFVKLKGHSSSLDFNSSANNNAVDQAEFEVVANQNGGYSVNYAGKTVSFALDGYSADKKAFTKVIEIDNGRITVAFGLGEGNDPAYKYTDYMSVITQNSVTKNSSTLFGIYGVETKFLPTSNTVDLNGSAAIITAPKKFIEGVGSSILVGKVKLTVDFSSNKIAGKIYQMQAPVVSGGDVNTKYVGELTLNNGNIAANGFSAELKGNAAFNTHLNGDVTGKIEGGFYGPNAEEVGGSISIENSLHFGVGSFRAK